MPAACCPNCRQPLEQLTVEALYGRQVVIDVCGPCQGFWFDEGEALQLSPDGTLALFRLVHERVQARHQPIGERLECARCGLRLTLVTDRQRDTTFQYFRCARGHGRFITFFHFLRSRNFVRNLSPRELATLRASIRQVACSNCGAPIDLDRHVACAYCRAPVSMLDPEQVQRSLDALVEASERRKRVDPALPLTLMLERLRTEKAFAEAGGEAARGRPGQGLVETGLSTLVQWLSGVR